MPSFEYIARDDAGVEQTGVMQADSASAVASSLAQRGLSLMHIVEIAARDIDPATRRHRELKVAAVAWAIIVLAVIAWAALLSRANARLADLNRQIDELRQSNAKLAVLAARVATIEQWQARQQDWLAHLANLSALIPPAQEVYVSGFSASGNKVTLDVKARDARSLTRFARDLQTSGGYEPTAQGRKSATDRFGYGVKDTLEIAVAGQARQLIAASAPATQPADDSPEGAQPASAGAAENATQPADSAPRTMSPPSEPAPSERPSPNRSRRRAGP